MSHAHKCQAVTFCSSAKYVQQGHGWRIQRWGKKRKKKSLQVKNPQRTWSRDTSGASAPAHLPQLASFLSFSFFKVLKVSMKWNHIVFSSITLALRYQKSTTGTFRKGPQTDPCPHFKWKSPPDTRRWSEAPRHQRWQKACVHCCSCWDGKPESTKSKCCFYLYPLTFVPSIWTFFIQKHFIKLK